MKTEGKLMLHKKNEGEVRKFSNNGGEMGNNEKIGERFTQILEVIYAIIMACGIATLIEVLSKYYPEISLNKWLAVLIAFLVLIRFFFAPSKNVKLLVKKVEMSKNYNNACRCSNFTSSLISILCNVF
jgi:asparagine N-glycosylation enzyme membrane subunit Stt3